ncbi:TauD/TfdA family dioxygenase [Streptomyces sp. NPDC093546]|uniref:TauD/TfdA family dioxygenase n=1 Tax=Streptomyces sp. NPDC093546 TaxID=3366040 RepID=UPI0038282493
MVTADGMVTADPDAVGGPKAWSRGTLREDDWLITLPSAWAENLRSAGPGAAGTALPPPPAALVTRVTEQLSGGPGVAVVRGWPLDGRTEEECCALAHWFGSYLGTPRPPNTARQGHAVLTAQLPAGHPSADPAHQGRDDGDLAFHTDRAGPPGPPRLLGLLCVRQAARGGESLLASGHTVHDRLLARHPAALPRLYRDFHFGRGDGFDRVYPVFRRHEGRLLVQYNRHWIERGQREAAAPLSAADLAALDAFDDILTAPGTAVPVRLRPGDLLLLDNAAVLHGRTAFTDTPHDPLRRRCLVRVWVD